MFRNIHTNLKVAYTYLGKYKAWASVYCVLVIQIIVIDTFVNLSRMLGGGGMLWWS